MFFINLLKSFENKQLYLLRYGDNIIKKWCKKYLGKTKTVIDVGIGSGRDIDIISDNCGVALPIGIDRLKLKNKSKMIIGDIECGIPIKKNVADLVVCHEVLEHCKNIHAIKCEIARVLKPGGYAIIGTPNLAAWHERLLLLFGVQPSEIRSVGYHIRGFTKNELIKYCLHGNMFTLIECKMAGFRPLYSKLYCTIMPSVFPGIAMNTLLLLQRTDVLERVSYFHESTYK